MTVYLKNIGTSPYILSGAAPVDPGDRLELTGELCAVNSASDPEAFGNRVVAAANANLPAPRLAIEIEDDEPAEPIPAPGKGLPVVPEDIDEPKDETPETATDDPTAEEAAHD
jgi:hypothetical protein